MNGFFANATTPDRWKTLSKSDSEFLAYLSGKFSSSHRAIPVQSLNVDSSVEQVTFEIVPLNSIQIPGFFKIGLQLMRPQTLVLSVGPMIVVMFSSLAHEVNINKAVALSSFLGVLFFHIAANLFNDYGDHMKGRDRLRDKGGSRVIQNGWLTAVQVNKGAWIFLIFAGLLGIPAVVMNFTPLVVLVGISALFALEFAFQRLRLKARGWSELVAYTLTGPLLTCGFSWAISQRVTLDQIFLGNIFGLTTLLYFHSANFENIMVDSQSGVRTWATRVGFDSSKKFFYFTSAALLVSAVVFVFGFEPRLQMLTVVVSIGIYLFSLNRRVFSLASPLSSNLSGLRWSIVSFAWFIVALFAVSFAAQKGGLLALDYFWGLH